MNKKLLLFVGLILACMLRAYAAYIVDFPVSLTQPDGSVISCFASGDEYYNWYHDENNFTIIQNNEGYYCYAINDGDKVVASQYRVGTVDPKTVGIPVGVSISAAAKTAIRKNILDNTPDKTTAKEYRAPKGARNTGTMNNLVVYIKFADQEEFTRDTTYYWEMFNKVDDPTYQSLQNYFEQVSYGMLSITSHFYPIPTDNYIVSYTDSHPREYYMPYDPVSAPTGYQGSQRNDREFLLLKNASQYVASMIPADLNIDYDDDGMVDNVVYIIKGAPTAWSTLLWPHRWSLYGEYAYINGKRVYDFNFQLETHLNGSQSSVLCHEMFHSLGAPDLYRYEDETITPIGRWDVMASNGNPAQSMAAYMKYKYGGWIDEIPEITQAGVYTLHTPWSPTNNMYKLASPNSTNEFFLFEFRNKDHLFETTLPGEGLLIYRVNPSENGNASGPPDELYVFRQGGTNTTTNGIIAQAPFSANSGRTEFSNTTNPPCFLRNNQPGGIHVINVSAVGETISFEIPIENFLNANFYSNTQDVTTGCEVDFFATTAHPITSWLWEFQDGIPATANVKNPAGIKFSQSGLKTIKLTVTSPAGTLTETKVAYINVSTQTPEADFYCSNPATCLGKEVTIFDNSTLCPTAWSWSFSPNTVEFVNGTNSNSQNPVIVLNSDANYDVTLAVTNVNGTTTSTKNSFITTLGLDIASYSLDFEGATSLEFLGLTVVNPDNKVTWGLKDIQTSQGINTAMFMDIFNYNVVSQRDYVILPMLHITGNFEMFFKHAYAMKTVYSDTLIVSISTDCGDTWTRLETYHHDANNSFATAPPQTTEFIPTNENLWCGNGVAACNSISLSRYIGTKALIRFETFKTAGNNLYIDDIHFTINHGISNNTLNENMVVLYPNPSKGIYNISVENSESQYAVYVYDILGNLVDVYNSTGNTIINISDKKSGMYFVKLVSDSINKTIKIIKE